jgi:hypothetical protein
MKGFHARPEFGAVLQAIESIIANIVEMRHCELIAVRWSR